MIHTFIENPCRKLRQKDTSKYHIQLSLAILLMLIVSFVLVVLSAENVASLYGGCVTVSVLVHYFTLVAVMWMGAEALLMFQKLVIVFVRITTKFIVAVSIVCWSKCNVRLIGLRFGLFPPPGSPINNRERERD